MLADSMCLCGEVPSVLYCNCSNPIKHVSNWKLWCLCGEHGPAVSLISPAAFLRPPLHEVIILPGTHKGSLLLLALH